MTHDYDDIILFRRETRPLCSTDCDGCCSEKLRLCLGLAAALVLFPLLVWGGYALLPFDTPELKSTPLRLVYTLRCAFFATVPIVLGKTSRGVWRSVVFKRGAGHNSFLKLTI